MSAKREQQKQEFIAGLVDARQKVLDAAQALPADCREEIFLGNWSVKDLVAHLIGWDYTNLRAVQEILEGKYPSFFQEYDHDWQSYNRRLVEQYRQDSWPKLFQDAAESHRQFVSFLQALTAEEVVNRKARKETGRTVTIRNLLRCEASDEDKHSVQITNFREQHP